MRGLFGGLFEMPKPPMHNPAILYYKNVRPTSTREAASHKSLAPALCFLKCGARPGFSSRACLHLWPGRGSVLASSVADPTRGASLLGGVDIGYIRLSTDKELSGNSFCAFLPQLESWNKLVRSCQRCTGLRVCAAFWWDKGSLCYT